MFEWSDVCMLIDLHTHTTAYSACSAVTPDNLVRAALAAGLDAVCITEHDAFWPLAAIRELGERQGLLVLRGIEVTTEVGHVLVYGLSTWRKGLSTLEALRGHVLAEDGLMFLAHPSRRYGRPVDATLPDVFDSVEVANASEGALQNANALQLARRCRLPGIGGSDAHTAVEVGAAATVLSVAVSDEAGLVAELRRGVHATMERPAFSD
jgi:predicted metal-dependent phosphoesterase TrpH